MRSCRPSHDARGDVWRDGVGGRPLRSRTSARGACLAADVRAHARLCCAGPRGAISGDGEGGCGGARRRGGMRGAKADRNAGAPPVRGVVLVFLALRACSMTPRTTQAASARIAVAEHSLHVRVAAAVAACCVQRRTWRGLAPRGCQPCEDFSLQSYLIALIYNAQAAEARADFDLARAWREATAANAARDEAVARAAVSVRSELIVCAVSWAVLALTCLGGASSCVMSRFSAVVLA